MALAMNKQFEEAMNVARQVICEAHNMDAKEAVSTRLLDLVIKHLILAKF